MSNKKSPDRNLFEEFNPITTEEWEQKISEDLNGADYKEELRWESGEGIEPLPFYRREDTTDSPRQSIISKGGESSWEIRQPIYEHDIESANEAAQGALNSGADSLQFYLNIQRTEGAQGGDMQGLPLQGQEDFSKLLSEIDISEVPLHFDCGLAAPALMGMLKNEANNRDLVAEDIQATLMYDPFVYILQKGQLPKSPEALEQDLTRLVQYSSSEFQHLRPLGIDGRFYHNAGASIVQELGFVLATASTYLATLTENGVDISETADAIHLNFAVGSKYFLEIAKFRAARLLWKNLIEAFGGDPQKHRAYIHAETARWNKSTYDPIANMLRTSTEGMSAAIANCDSISSLPFDEHLRQPDNFSERIARNQQLVLSEEAYLDKVADPSAGSYYIEQLTDQIGEAAWKLFQEVEAEGGLLEAIENGTIQSAIHESQQHRDQALAKRERIFVGSTQYANAEDTMAEKLGNPHQVVSLNESDYELNTDNPSKPENIARAFSEGAKMGDIAPHLFDYGKQYIRTVNTYRGAQAFEELRMATEGHDQTPSVLMLPLGNKKWRSARSRFSANFFGSAGYNIESPVGFEDTDAAVDAVKNKQPDIIVICSSDEEYEQLVPAICDQLDKLKHSPMVVLAGHPKKQIETYKEAGVNEFIYGSCNALETLKRFQQKLGIIKNVE